MLTEESLEKCSRRDCDNPTKLHCSNCGVPACWRHMFDMRSLDALLCLECYLKPIKDGTYITVHHFSGNKES